MSISGETPRENLTLTEADLAACRPIVGEGGHVLRALCPSTAPTASAACGCRCIAAVSCVLPVGPGAIWRRRVRSGARSSSARRPCRGLQPHRQRVPHRREPPSQLPSAVPIKVF